MTQLATEIDQSVYQAKLSARYQMLVGGLAEEVAALEAYAQALTNIVNERTAAAAQLEQQVAQQTAVIQELRGQVALYTEQAWDRPPVTEGNSSE